jgi:hypothetical protein
MQELLCPVSIGEVLDKISILRIKAERITDASKLRHVQHELARLTAVIGNSSAYESFLNDLYEFNRVIWNVEDQLRLKERRCEFDQDFAQLARTAYLTNDKRFAVKAAANQHFGSAIQEQKSYEEHQP